MANTQTLFRRTHPTTATAEAANTHSTFGHQRIFFRRFTLISFSPTIRQILFRARVLVAPKYVVQWGIGTEDFDMPKPPLQPVMDLLEHVRGGRVLQVSGNPDNAVRGALNILSGLENTQTLTVRPQLRGEKWKTVLGWAADPQYSVLRQLDEAALNWAHNEGYLDHAMHVHAAAPLPGLTDPVRVTGADNILVVHSPATGELGLLSDVNSGCERVLMLFSQAIEEHLRHRPLRVINTGLSVASEEGMNAWGVRTLSGSQHVGAFVLRKAFAETYAAVMVLAGTEGSAAAQNAVTALRDRAQKLHRVWDGERDVWAHHMGGKALTQVLENVNGWIQTPPSDLWGTVEQLVGAEFGKWLRDQPLVEIVVDDVIPSFEQRLMDMVTHIDTFLPHLDAEGPLARHLAPVHAHVQHRWSQPLSLSPSGVFQLAQKLLQRSGWALGISLTNNVVIQQHAEAFAQERQKVVAGILEEIKPPVAEHSLAERLERYRKPPQVEPYTLPPVP